MKINLKVVRRWLIKFFVSCFESINEGMLSTDNVIESTKKCAKDFYRLGLSDEEIILSQFSAPSNTARAVEVATNSGSDTNKSKK
jgi:hypothetical protein